MTTLEDVPKLLTPGEVAAMFRVDPKTVTRWAAAGRLPFIRTPGGHCRFREVDVNALFDRVETPPRPDPLPPLWRPYVSER